MRRKCTEKLVQWKKNPDRKPLVLRGIRQTGKTWLLRDFGEKNYDVCIYINLETEKPVRDFLSDLKSPEEILLFLEAYSGKPVRRDTTLLILDNYHIIEKGPRILAEIGLDFPGYHVAAIERGSPGSSRYDLADAETCALFPMDFEEFLWADKEYSLAKEIRSHFSSLTSMGKVLHGKASAKLRLYLAVGGMPASVLEYRKEKKLLMVPDIQSQIYSLILADITNNASGNLAHHARNCFQSVPMQICKGNGKFQYKQVIAGGTAKVYEKPLEWLMDSGFLYPSSRTRETSCKSKETAYRYYFPDVGLFVCCLGIPAYLILTGDRFLQDRGIMEMFLAQSFAQNGYSLSSWTSGNQAVVPFLLEHDKQLKVVDFRMDTSEKMRNLARFKDCGGFGDMYLLSPGDFQKKETYNVLPFYSAFCI